MQKPAPRRGREFAHAGERRKTLPVFRQRQNFTSPVTVMSRPGAILANNPTWEPS